MGLYTTYLDKNRDCILLSQGLKLICNTFIFSRMP